MTKKIVCLVMAVLMLAGTTVSANCNKEDLPIGYYNIVYADRYLFFATDGGSSIDFLKLPRGTKVNLVITDPPYNVNYEGSAGKIKNDNMDNDKFYNFLLDAFVNTESAMSDDASIYVFHADTEGLNFRKAFEDAGFYLSGCCIWEKQSLVLGRSPYQWQHEPCLYGWKKNGKHQWYTGRKESTIWEFDKPKKNKDHPTMKPIALCGKAIINSSERGDIISDPFGGSGSTLMAAEQLGRRCFMMELDPRYCDVIVDRWNNRGGVRPLKTKTERSYKLEIIKRMKAIGTYREEFLPTIERLARRYCQRDKLEV